MSILLNEHTNLLIQGITGKEGQRALAWAQAYDTRVLAGVTPGKGGQAVNGVPVFNTVAEALSTHPTINATSIYAPPPFVRSAALEAIAAGIPLVHIIGEEVPTRDTVDILAAAAAAGVRVVGPSSIGLIAPGKAKIGSIGGDNNDQFRSGSVAIMSKSGGMSSEIALLLTKHGFGQSTVVGIGGNIIIGTTFADVVDDLEKDAQTKAVVIIGELGGSYEEDLAEKLQQSAGHKPYIAFISGRFAETLPQGMSFGHAGAIVDAQYGTRAGKIAALQAAGVMIAESPSEILTHLQSVIAKDYDEEAHA